MTYTFTNNWFEQLAKPTWDQLIPQLNPRRVLEIGSHEGASSCCLIQHLGSSKASLEIHCVDTWEGGIEHQTGGDFATDMGAVEDRFRQNIDVAITEQIRSTTEVIIHKSLSCLALAGLIHEGQQGFFDRCNAGLHLVAHNRDHRVR